MYFNSGSEFYSFALENVSINGSKITPVEFNDYIKLEEQWVKYFDCETEDDYKQDV